VVGTGYTAATPFEAFRWTQAGGMVGLGTSSVANAVNADGTVLVGYSVGIGAFRWTQAGGMESVQALLTAKGVSTTGWTLERAQGVSADGQVIVGIGTDPNGRTQGWIARLGPPPALQVTPATNIVAAAAQGGGIFSPSSFDYQLGATTGSVKVSISGIPSWLNASFTTATLTTSPLTVTFSLNDLGTLGRGTYSATIAFTNTTNGQGDTTRTATLRIYNKDDCKKGGWQNFISPPGPFNNQGQCVSYFAQLVASP
jgi:uncharacterized membrane protein